MGHGVRLLLWVQVRVVIGYRHSPCVSFVVPVPHPTRELGWLIMDIALATSSTSSWAFI